MGSVLFVLVLLPFTESLLVDNNLFFNQYINPMISTTIADSDSF